MPGTLASFELTISPLLKFSVASDACVTAARRCAVVAAATFSSASCSVCSIGRPKCPARFLRGLPLNAAKLLPDH